VGHVPAGHVPAGYGPPEAVPPGYFPRDAAPPRRWLPDPAELGRTLLLALAVALVAAALGVPHAVLWSAVAPEIPVIKVDGGVVTAEAAPEQPVAGDGWFAILALGFGVIAGLAAWWLARRRRGPVILGGLALGAIAGGVLAAWLGQKIGLSGYERAVAAASPGTALSHPPDLRIAEVGLWRGFLPRVTGVQLIEAFGAVVMYTLLAGWSRFSSLRKETEPPEYLPQVPSGDPVPVAWTDGWQRPDPAVSWDLSAPPDRSASPAPPESREATPPRE
jgi:hypothetical protein